MSDPSLPLRKTPMTTKYDSARKFSYYDVRDLMAVLIANPRARVVTFFHDDMDGRFAAASISKALKQSGFELVFKAVNYNSYSDEEILGEVNQGDCVLVVDFGFSAELSDKLYERTSFFVTLDHHKTNRAALNNKPYAIFDMNRSGAKMTYEWSIPRTVMDIPLAIVLADARDMWNKEDPRVDQFHQVTTAFVTDWKKGNPDNPYGYIQLLSDYLDKDEDVELACRLGEAMLKKMSSNIQHVCIPANIIHTHIGGHPAVVVNYPVDQSDACEYLYSQPEYQDKICAAVSFRGNSASFSLRKNQSLDVDLAHIAETNYGGGGHAAAAGFSTTYQRAISILTDKEKWAYCWKASEVDTVLHSFQDKIDFADKFNSLKGEMRSRAVCEDDTSVLQVLPYIVIRDPETGNILSYRRPATGDEGRLHGKLSIGFGGHIDTLPGTLSPSEHIGSEAARELQEELGIDPGDFDVATTVKLMFENGNFGVLRLLDTAVEAVHVGLTFIIDITPEFIRLPNEEEVGGVTWVTVEELRVLAKETPIEIWSQTILNVDFNNV